MTKGRLVAALFLLAPPLHARDLSLAMPIDCTLGQTCYIQNLVDHDPSPATSDFQCGALTYDGHKGTDFGLPSDAQMQDGVSVVAAAPGTVRGVRDSMPDIRFDAENAPDVAGVECGNGVVITHGDGWETQYCHMKEGSVVVAPGDRVQIGTVLGEVGLSGKTQFPHLHFEVRHNRNRIDPFDPDGQISCDTVDPDTLWSAPLAAPAGGILNAAFSSAVPEYSDIKAGLATETLTATSPALVLWAFAYGARPHDEIRLTITGPSGVIFEGEHPLETAQALFFRAGGRRAPAGGWPAGIYVGVTELIRDGETIDSLRVTATLN